MPLAAAMIPSLRPKVCTLGSKIVLDKTERVRYLIPFFGKIQILDNLCGALPSTGPDNF
jgi:hypothetical protein